MHFVTIGSAPCCLLLLAVVSLPSSATPHDSLEVMGRTTYMYKPRPCALHSCTGQNISSMRENRAAVLVLHGSGVDAQSMFEVGFEPLSDLHGFLVVYPEMKTPKAEIWGYASDIPYFTSLVHRLQESDYNIRPDKFFICGHSAGGTMSTFLQNEVDLFSAAGSVEAAVGHLDGWNMSRVGHRTMIVWNHADPVLHSYAPNKSETAYFAENIKVLRRGGGTTPHKEVGLPVGGTTHKADVLFFKEQENVPELRIVSFETRPGQHTWPSASWTIGVDAAEQLVAFFFEAPSIYESDELQDAKMSSYACQAIIFIAVAMVSSFVVAVLIRRKSSNQANNEEPLLLK